MFFKLPHGKCQKRAVFQANRRDTARRLCALFENDIKNGLFCAINILICVRLHLKSNKLSVYFELSNLCLESRVFNDFCEIVQLNRVSWQLLIFDVSMNSINAYNVTLQLIFWWFLNSNSLLLHPATAHISLMQHNLHDHKRFAVFSLQMPLDLNEISPPISYDKLLMVYLISKLNSLVARYLSDGYFHWSTVCMRERQKQTTHTE